MICCILIIVTDLRIGKVKLTHILIMFCILVVSSVLALTLICSLHDLSGSVFFWIFIFNILLWLIMLRLEILFILEITMFHDTIEQNGVLVSSFAGHAKFMVIDCTVFAETELTFATSE